MFGMMSAICSYFLLGGKMSAFWLFFGLDGCPSSLIFPTLDGSAEATPVGQLLCFHKFVTVLKFPTLKYTSFIPRCRASPISDRLTAHARKIVGSTHSAVTAITSRPSTAFAPCACSIFNSAFLC